VVRKSGAGRWNLVDEGYYPVLILAYLFSCIWPPIQSTINWLGMLMIESDSIGLFLYGFLNQLLIVIGLHHIINNLV